MVQHEIILIGLHDTVGIAFQRRPEDPSFSQTVEARTYIRLKRNRNRAYDSTGIEIEPYRKKPKLLQEFSTAEEIKKTEESVKLLLIETRNEDIRWMLTVMFDKNNETPMWTEWNFRQEKKSEEKKIIQNVLYLPQINESPTSHFVVVETLKRSLKIADEANADSISVMYDLTIAKIALQVQGEEKPTFDRIFTSLGSFHIEMTFFSAIGKVIAESGGPFFYKSYKFFMTTVNNDKIDICKNIKELNH